MNCQVITESGQLLGRVLGFSFDIETGDLISLVMGAVGVPLLGEGVLSTWEIAVEEIVSSGTDRIIVYEGAEDKLKQLNSGFLEKLGVGGSSWEEQERDRYRVNLVPVENQLISGEDIQQNQRALQSSKNETFNEEEEFEYVELEDRRDEVIQKRRYIDEPQLNSYSESYNQENSFTENQSIKEDAYVLKNDSSSMNPSSSRRRRHPLGPQEPMDVEPLDLSSKKEKKINDPFDSEDSDVLDDPW
ncbi:MAG: photosystem reaction center subunit H [Candidatus Marinimicrobia bacterium]|nr:photosystem reaction center subunit H [Candidatus Neomarinimicrobiota bacterium]